MIRVIVERHCRPDSAAEVESLLLELKVKAMTRGECISGEMLRSSDDPSYWLAISTWNDKKLWETWDISDERQEIVRKIDALLVAPAKASVFHVRSGE